MRIESFLERFIKVGSLTLIDVDGKSYRFVGTPTPDVTIQLCSRSFARRLLRSPQLALGEGYVNGDFIIKKGNVFDLLMMCAGNLQYTSLSPLKNFFRTLGKRFFHSRTSISKSQHNISYHYDLSEALYRLFLDKDMQYSCGYFKNIHDDLETAQENKKRHLTAKLQIKPGQKILDIGCGWGGFALSLAREANVHVVGLTLSKEQHRIATARAKEAGLADRVSFQLKDYRQETGLYDRIVSMGMFEHVGPKQYDEFFSKVSSLLKENGLAVLHSIGRSTGPNMPNPWLDKYIFPGGYCPALSETMEAIEDSKLHATDIEILHHHYAETLRHWRKRFLDNRERVLIAWGPRFLRMWEYYLTLCEVAFRKQGFMAFQIQMVKNQENASLTRDYMREEERKFKGVLISLDTKRNTAQQATRFS